VMTGIEGEERARLVVVMAAAEKMARAAQEHFALLDGARRRSGEDRGRQRSAQLGCALTRNLLHDFSKIFWRRDLFPRDQVMDLRSLGPHEFDERTKGSTGFGSSAARWKCDSQCIGFE